MASPDVFSIAAGTRIAYGGRGVSLPSWVPPAGERRNFSLNKISDVYPVSAPNVHTRGSKGLLNSWSSTIYVPTMGTLGSVFAGGIGGHTNYLGNECYLQTVDTRLWARISEPYNFAIDSNDAATVSDAITGEYWTDLTRTAVVVNQPVPTHTYGNEVWVPGSVAGNTNGWAVIIGNFSWQSHKVDLDNPSAGWSRFGPLMNSTVLKEQQGYGCALVDVARAKIVTWPHTNGAQEFNYELTVPGGVLTTRTSNYVFARNMVASHDLTDDLYILLSASMSLDSGRIPITVIDPVTNTRYSPTSSGALPPATTLGSVGWIESTRQLYYWPWNDGGGTTVYFAQAPANPKTGDWVWTARVFTGDTPAGLEVADTAPMYSRLHYVPALHALIHTGQTVLDSQIWKL